MIAPQTVHQILINTLLAVTVATVWIGAVGMLRVRQPIQALHYIAVPASVGVLALTLAVFLQVGFKVVAWKCLLIAVVLLGINAVVAHATARAFRVRELGRWQHRKGDGVELVTEITPDTTTTNTTASTTASTTKDRP